MRNFPDSFETRKRSFTNAFLSCMTVPLIKSLCFAYYRKEANFMVQI